MKKLYIAPEMEVLRCELIEDVLSPSTEPTVPIQDNTEPNYSDPTTPVIDDF